MPQRARIGFRSIHSASEVVYYARTPEQLPRAWTIESRPAGGRIFKDDIATPGGGVPRLVREVSAEGLPADLAVNLWTVYHGLWTIVRETPCAPSRWSDWVQRQYPDIGSRSVAEADATLIGAIGNLSDPHPVTMAMKGFMLARRVTHAADGLTPPGCLLPPAHEVPPGDLASFAMADVVRCS